VAQYTTGKDISLAIEMESHTWEYQQYAHLKQVLEGDHPQFAAQRNKAQAELDLGREMQDLDVRFGVLDELPAGPEHLSYSLFEGLTGVARGIAASVPLISEDQLTKPVQSRPLEGQNPKKSHQDNNLDVTERKVSPSSSLLSRTNSSDNVTTVSNLSKREADPVSIQETPMKKRKSDIGLQHLQMEKLAIEQLTTLVKLRISLKDEDAEYESSDLWIELPNTDHILHDSVITEIQGHLIKVSQTPLMKDIPFEILDRLQQLVMRSIRYCNEIDWIDCNPSSLLLAVNALKAMSLMLAILNLQRPEKQLYLDDYITESLSFLYKFIEDYLLNAITMGQADGNVMNITTFTSRILLQFNSYLQFNNQNDMMITKLEYLSIMVIFQEGDKLLLSFKTSAMLVLLTIFKGRDDQRAFIIDELLINFDRLPTHKVNSRQVRLDIGVSAQFTTILLLNLINTLAITEGYGNEINVKVPQLTDADLKKRALEDERFRVHVKKVQVEKQQLCASIASTLVSKLVSSSSFKPVLELLITDLLNLVKYPDYNSAEPLLCRLTEYLVSFSEGQSAIVESNLLELLGLIGTAMIEIRGSEESHHRSISDLKSCYCTVSHCLSQRIGSTNSVMALDSVVVKWVGSLLDSVGSFDKPLSVEGRNEYATLISLIGWCQFNKNSDLLITKRNQTIQEKDVLEQNKILLQQSEFMSLYQNFLNHLLQSVDHPKIKSRTRALKNLAMLIEKDQRLIHIPQVRQTLTNRIKDASPLVRLAVLDIIDQYILQRPELIVDFYQSIILTGDKSTAVRNRSIKIAKRIMCGTPDSQIQLFLIEKVMKRFEDEEASVIEAAKMTLTEVFFLIPSAKASGDNMKLKQECSKLILIIGALIGKSASNWDIFEDFLFNDIIRLTDENKKNHSVYLQVCHRMAEALFSFIIDNMDTDLQKDVDSCLGLLSMFSKSDIPFIDQEQLMSLQPYFTSDSAGSSAISYYSLVILRNTLASTTSLRDQFLDSTQASLLKRLTKLNTRELEEAMPSVWTLSEMRNDTSKISNAAYSCLLLIQPYIGLVKENKLDKNDPKVVRLLYLLGGFGKYCDLERNREVFTRQQKLGLKDKETVLSLLTKIIVLFTKSSVHKQIRKSALRNVIHIATTHPKLFSNDRILQVLDSELLDSTDLSLKSSVLQGILEFLEKEEKDALKRASRDVEVKSADAGKLIHGNQKLFANDDICSSLTQRYLDTSIKLSSFGATDVEVFSGVKFLRFVVRMGFANPVVCIGPVIDLQVSKYPHVRSVGLELHRQLHERHESLIDNLYAPSVFRAFRLGFENSNGNVLEDTMFIQKLYRIFEDSKVTRKKFLKQLSRTLELKNFKLKDGLKEMAYYSRFLLLNLLDCEFSTNEEVCILLEEFESFLGQNGTVIRTEVQKAMNSGDHEVIDALGYSTTILLMVYKLTSALRYNYRLNEGTNLSEWRMQKSKMSHDKFPVILTIYSEDDGARSSLFSVLETLLV
jgi:cohesin loading factor subunit SCC2